jgi:hypothetical protein
MGWPQPDRVDMVCMASWHAAFIGMPGIEAIAPIPEQQLFRQPSSCSMHEVQARSGWAARSVPMITIASWRTRFIGLRSIWLIGRSLSVIRITCVENPAHVIY